MLCPHRLHASDDDANVAAAAVDRAARAAGFLEIDPPWFAHASPAVRQRNRQWVCAACANAVRDAVVAAEDAAHVAEARRAAAEGE